ncbi:hypothetical protein KAR91_68895 [Candidatus Pacearchaeota archaeon]|nr:hypothetical protein [Candidatus Pacearchaeota archaeon]
MSALDQVVKDGCPSCGDNRVEINVSLYDMVAMCGDCEGSVVGGAVAVIRCQVCCAANVVFVERIANFIGLPRKG